MDILLTKDNGIILGPIARILGVLLNAIFNIFPNVGKQRIEEAANYEYNKKIYEVCTLSEIEKHTPGLLLLGADNIRLLTQNRYFALEPFKEEITKYYDKINNKKFK